jgi:hypothetical protein
MPPKKKKKKTKRLEYGPAKYAAFHLLLCRWMRHHGVEGQFQYVTLGGTELRDIQSLHYIDDQCTSGIVSYELKKKEHGLVSRAARGYRARACTSMCVARTYSPFNASVTNPICFSST